MLSQRGVAAYHAVTPLPNLTRLFATIASYYPRNDSFSFSVHRWQYRNIVGYFQMIWPLFTSNLQSEKLLEDCGRLSHILLL